MNMVKDVIYLAGSTPALHFAKNYLRTIGLNIAEDPQGDVQHLVLDVPSFNPNGDLKDGRNIGNLLQPLSRGITISGGNLQHPDLLGYKSVDFLQDDIYLCENAYITAECALDVAFPYLGRTIRRCPVLIIGWGRIGKCLGLLLKNMGADVIIAARNPSQRAMIHAFGYDTVDTAHLSDCLGHFRLLYNTVPYPILNQEELSHCGEDCIKIELASKDGIKGDDVIVARGLPGIHMAESSGELIANTFLRLCYGR